MSPRFIGDGSAHGLENARRHPRAIEPAELARRLRRRHRAHLAGDDRLTEEAEVHRRVMAVLAFLREEGINPA